MSRRLSETMSKRKSLNRRSSRSSRYTGSAILDPDTDVIDNSHPYWWKNLENNTMGRPSIDFNMLNETSRQLDSNSQIEGNEAKDEWWKVLETLNSPQVVERNPKPDTAKNVSSTSESEEEPRIVKRKLPLRLRTKSHQANAFINALNDSKDPSVSEPVPETRKKSSLTKSDLDNKTITNKEQLTEALDSSLNQSLNSNNVLKSKPKIFKDYKDRNKNLFIDVLQNDELKVSFKERSFIEKSSKIMVRKDSSRVEAPLYNQSRSTDYMSSFEGTNDLSHLPAPKAQSTTLEHSTSHNSNRNDSASDAEHRIVKPKPRLLKRRSRIPKKNVFQDIFESEQTDEGAEKTKSTNKNVAENIEISKQFSGSSSDNLPRISQKPPEDIVNEENLETEENEALRLRKKRKSAIVATESIKRSMDLCLNSLGSAVKRKSTQGKSASNHNFIGGKTNENILSIDNRNETQVSEDVSSNSTNEEGPNKLQRRFEVNTSPTFNKKERRDTDNRSRVSTRNSNLEPSMKESTQTNARISDVGDKGIEETEDKVPTDSSEEVPYADKEQVNISQRRSDTNVLSSSNRTERRDTENRSRVSSRTSNLVSSMRKSFQKNARTSNVGDKGIEETEDEVPTDSSEEVPYADMDKVNISQRRSATNVLSSSNRTERRDTENRSRVSSRTSNLVSSMRKSFQANARTSNVGDKEMEETENEVPTDFNDHEVLNKLHYADNVSEERSVDNTLPNSSSSDHRNTETRANYLASLANKIVDMNSSASTDIDENLMEIEDEVSSDSSKAEEQENIFERRSLTRISNLNAEEGNDTGRRSRLTTASNLASTQKRINQPNTDALDAEIPKKSQRSGPNTNIFQRMSGANTSSALNRKESTDTKNRTGALKKTSNLLSPFISTPTIREICKSKLQTTIRNFFSADRTPKIATKQLFSEEQNGGRIKGELEMMKKREMDCMDANAKKQHETKSLPTVAKIAKAGKNKRASKQVHKAYLVNGRVYRVPRLPRPKSWVTDRLYNYLWKCMEPKYKLETRVISEKFVRQLSDVTSLIAKQKSYLYYRSDLYALMKEMARLGIIRTRNDFYNFCHDFFPYELRVKMVPMLLPGNKRNIPYDPNELHTPILDEFR